MSLIGEHSLLFARSMVNGDYFVGKLFTLSQPTQPSIFFGQ